MKARKTQKVVVPVQFVGSVDVFVPAHLSDSDKRLLAEKIALSRIVATTDNPDAPDEDAFDDYRDECSKKARRTASKDWDSITELGVGGGWSNDRAVMRFAVVQEADGQVIGPVRARATLNEAIDLALELAAEQTDIHRKKLRAELEAEHWVADPDGGWAVYVTDLTD